MPRPKKSRCVGGYPVIESYIPENQTPTGVIQLSVEGMEALRLSDFEHLDQETAAKMMEVSRQTYGRILAEARSIVAEAILTGKTLKIGGGTYVFRGRQRHRRRRCGGGNSP